MPIEVYECISIKMNVCHSWFKGHRPSPNEFIPCEYCVKVMEFCSNAAAWWPACG